MIIIIHEHFDYLLDDLASELWDDTMCLRNIKEAKDYPKIYSDILQTYTKYEGVTIDRYLLACGSISVKALDFALLELMKARAAAMAIYELQRGSTDFLVEFHKAYKELGEYCQDFIITYYEGGASDPSLFTEIPSEKVYRLDQWETV